MGFFDKLKKGLSKTRENITNKIEKLIIGYADIDDDLLDELGDETQMGKRLGKDHAVGKLTWPGLYGIEQAGNEAARQIDKAVKAAGFFGARGEFLIALAQNSLKRVI